MIEFPSVKKWRSKTDRVQWLFPKTIADSGLGTRPACLLVWNLLALAQNVANKNMWQGNAEKPTPTLLAVAFDVAKAEVGAQAGAESGAEAEADDFISAHYHCKWAASSGKDMKHVRSVVLTAKVVDHKPPH